MYPYPSDSDLDPLTWEEIDAELDRENDEADRRIKEKNESFKIIENDTYKETI